MKNVENISRHFYEEHTKVLGFHETYYIIRVSWDVMFWEDLEYVLGNTYFLEIGDKQ